jgi:nucleoside 2-deoxyribosyltransferase
MKIYLAGPVVTDNKEIKQQMEDLEYTIEHMRLPVLHPGECDMRDDYVELYRPGKHKVPNAWGIDMRTWGQCVFTMDVVAIDECEWMVLADYGRSATAGTSWEAGYAFAKGVKILVVQMPGVEESSLMTQGCAANICKYEDFIAGIDYDGSDWQIDDAIWGSKFEKFFYERGRKPQDHILN